MFRRDYTAEEVRTSRSSYFRGRIASGVTKANRVRSIAAAATTVTTRMLLEGIDDAGERAVHPLAHFPDGPDENEQKDNQQDRVFCQGLPALVRAHLTPCWCHGGILLVLRAGRGRLVVNAAFPRSVEAEA